MKGGQQGKRNKREKKEETRENLPERSESNRSINLMTSEVTRQWWGWLKMKATDTAS
jgi:hypothetical protein